MPDRSSLPECEGECERSGTTRSTAPPELIIRTAGRATDKPRFQAPACRDRATRSRAGIHRVRGPRPARALHTAASMCEFGYFAVVPAPDAISIATNEPRAIMARCDATDSIHDHSHVPASSASSVRCPPFVKGVADRLRHPGRSGEVSPSAVFASVPERVGTQTGYRYSAASFFDFTGWDRL